MTASIEEITFPFATQRDKALSELSTFVIGGPARHYTEVSTITALQEIIGFCHVHQIRHIVIGKGSNSLFDDRGFDGLVIGNRIGFLEQPSPHLFYVGAGYNFSRLGAFTARHGWSGLEFASGIPGSVGGAVFMNAGANGGETADTLVSVLFVDSEGGLKEYKKKELVFSYRHSSFQKMQGAIAAATFSLTEAPTARARQLEIVDYRMKTQPYSEPSVGCIFRNPGQACPSAGALIDQAGLKGMAVGGAKVSPVHANFVVNAGGATARDVLSLIDLVRQRVQQQSGVVLESEMRYIPFQGDSCIPQK